jgi:hypothetical protein
MLAALVGVGLSIVGIAGNGIGRLSTNGLVGGLAGAVVPHNTGSAGGVMAVDAYDFHDVNMVGPKVGPKTVAAPAAAPILITSLRVTPELLFLVFLFFLAI